MIRKAVTIIPNTLTSLNLLSGCMAVLMAFHLHDTYYGLSGEHWLYIFVGAAALFDFCDGLSARMLKAYSDIGKELDSLSDLVSFGVAPGMLMLNIMLAHSDGSPVSLAALIIPLCGALRLAKFNVDTNQSTTFTGMPIPANAIFFIGFADWMARYTYPNVWIIALVVVLVALSMVCSLRMFSLKFHNLSFVDNAKRYGIVIATVAFVWLYGVSGLMWTIILYFLISFFLRKQEED